MLNAQNVLQLLNDELDFSRGSTVINLEPLKVIKGRVSFIMQCRLFTDDGQNRLAWVKIRNPSEPPEIAQRRIAREFDINSLLYGVIDKTGTFRVPEPLFHAYEHRLVVLGHVDGIVLQKKIEAQARYRVNSGNIQGMISDCRLAGAWLAKFQSLTEGYCPGQNLGNSPMVVKGAERVVEQTTSRLYQIVDEDPRMLSPAMVRDIERFLHDNLAYILLEDEIVCTIHGDFFAGNLIVDDRCITGLDFESATWGTPLFDLGYFVFQLETLQGKWRYRNSVVNQLVDAFLGGYGMDTDHRNFWVHDPTLRILLVSYTISRLLFLAGNTRKLTVRGIYRRLVAHNLLKRLRRHFQTCRK